MDVAPCESWVFFDSCADGERLEIQGIDVWQCKWVRCDGEMAVVRDPHYQERREFEVYTLVQGERRVRMAAGEFSNGIWGFYVPVSPGAPGS